MNYFLKHGATVPDNEIELLWKARWIGYRIILHELKNHGGFESRPISGLFTFAHEGQLYYFDRHQNGRIKSIHKMNMKKSECINGNYGGYYQMILRVKKPSMIKTFHDLFRQVAAKEA